MQLATVKHYRTVIVESGLLLNLARNYSRSSQQFGLPAISSTTA
jgi:hypothetical protein